MIRTVDTPEETTVHFTYHPDLNVRLSRTEPSVLDTGDKVTVWDYDTDGNDIPNENPTSALHRIVETGFTLNETGAVVPYAHTRTFAYNTKGQVVSEDGPLAGDIDEKRYTFDPVTGDLLSVAGIDAVTYGDYDGTGRPGEITDADGNTTRFTYDARGRTLSRTDPTGGVTERQYGPSGELISETDPDGLTRTYRYDPAPGRLEWITDPSGAAIAYGYDDAGNRTEIRYHRPDGETVFLENSAYQNHKLVKTVHADNTFTEYRYDAMGNLTERIDPELRATTYHHDLFGRIETVHVQGEVQASYTYDLHGNLASVTDGNGNRTEYVYDDMARVVSTHSPDTGHARYAYDAGGNLVLEVKNDNPPITHTYDGKGRLTGSRYADDTDDVLRTYDAAGRLIAMADRAGSTDYQYDADGQLVRQTDLRLGQTYEVAYSYSPGGRLTSVTYPNGLVAAYQHNPLTGRIEQVTVTYGDATVTLASGITHLPFGPLEGMVLGNGMDVARTYDLSYRLKTTRAGNALDLAYEHFASGNVEAIDDHADPERDQVFAYDDQDRLTSAIGPYGAIDYTYDAAGNRLSKTDNGAPTAYTYTPGTNRLERVDAATSQVVTHDADGNVTSILDTAPPPALYPPPWPFTPTTAWTAGP